MNWGAPHILWLLLALPVWLWAAHRLLRARRRRLAAWVDEKNAPFLLPGRNPAAASRRIWLRTLALACLILALARPQWGFHWEEITRRGLDLLVVLDTSRSMTAADIKPSRLQQAKWGIHDLLRALRGDRVGLIPFAGSSLLQCPLTTDYAAFAMTLDDLYCGIIPRGGTAIAQALRTAIDSFPDDTTADRCILLVTDGEDHEGDPLSLLPELKQKGIRLYAIGIGTLEGEMIPGDATTGSAYFKDRKGQIVKTTLHEDILQQLATSTGGAYVRSAAGDTGLERVFRESIDKLKRSEAESRTAKINEERFQWPLLLSLLLLLLESLTPDTLGARASRPRGARGQSPRPLHTSSVPVVPVVPVVTALLLALPTLTRAQSPAPSPRPLFALGLADLAASNYPAAASNFLAAAKLAPSNDLPAAPALYNAALATAAAGDPDAATSLFAESAQSTADLSQQARAYYNRGNTLYGLADAASQNPLPALAAAAAPSTPNAPAPADPSKLIDEALQCYENAIALDPSAPDYKANYELALLKQQQIQQQQQQQQQQQNQDQSQDQQNQDQSSSDDQQQSQQQDQQQQEGEQEQQQDQQSPSSPQSPQSPSPSQEPPPQPQSPEDSTQMTPEEATQLLDAMRAREQSQRDQLKPLFGRPIPVENDW